MSVEWEVVSGGALDIQPTRGVVLFLEDQTSSTFEISALPDNVSGYCHTLAYIGFMLQGET